MFCPRCATQAEPDSRFCKTCGTKLSDHARLLDQQTDAKSADEETLRRDSQLISGVFVSILTSALLFVFIGFFGVVAIPRLPDGMKTRFLLVFLFLAGLLLAAAFSSILLLALGGFFRIAKKHRLRYALVMAERQRFAAANAIEMGERDSSAEASLFDLSGAPTYEPQRVTEATTRDFGEK